MEPDIGMIWVVFGLGTLLFLFGAALATLQAAEFSIEEIKSVLSWRFWLSRLPFAFVALGLSTFFEFGTFQSIVAFVFFCFITGIAVESFFFGSNWRTQEAEFRSKIEKAEREVEENPEKSRPIWDLSRKKLEIYIERNLSQVRSIYWITVIIMMVGFVLISYGVFRSFQNDSFEGAVLTTAAGVLTEFIAATFLLIYRATMKQASDYVVTLERINSIGMAIQIVDSLPEDQAQKKSDTKAMIAKELAGHR